MNEKDFNYQDAEKPDLSSSKIKSDAPFIIGGINFAASGIIFDSARTKFGKKENEVINSFLIHHKDIISNIYDVYADGNCCIYNLHIILCLNGIGDINEDPRVFVPRLRKELKNFISMIWI